LFRAKGNVVGAAEALLVERRVRVKAGSDPSLLIDLTEETDRPVVDQSAHLMS
jgi:hypothetical protein